MKTFIRVFDPKTDFLSKAHEICSRYTRNIHIIRIYIIRTALEIPGVFVEATTRRGVGWALATTNHTAGTRDLTTVYQRAALFLFTIGLAREGNPRVESGTRTTADTTNHD